MSGFEVVLLLIGALLVFISFLLMEKLAVEHNNAYIHPDPKELKENVEALKNEIDNYLEQAKETTIESVNDSLCHLSNEKIMSVNEYGEMILERIDKNHSEVVFLYGMLTDKEKELKQLIITPDQMQEQSKNADLAIEKDGKQTNTPEMSFSGSQVAKVEQAMLDYNEENNHELFEIRQNQILEMFTQGKPIPEIAKQLDIGQGEVQLVVNIFTGGSQ